jgi:O-antigen ligase
MMGVFPQPAARGMHTYLNAAGLTGVGLFAFGAYSSRALGNLGLAALVLMAILNIDFWRYLRASRLAWVSLVFVLYALGLTLWTSHVYPDSQTFQWTALKQWAALFLFLPLAWWLDGREKRIEAVLILFFAGWLVNFALYVDWPRFFRFDFSVQLDFGLKAIPSGLVAAANVLGLLYFADRFVSSGSLVSLRMLLLMFWSFGLLASIYALGASHARGVWLALLIAMPLLAWWWRRESKKKAPVGRAWPVMALGLALVMGMVVMNNATLSGRVNLAVEQMSEVISDDGRDVHHTSIGYRYHMLQFGQEKWVESPIFGWGPGAGQWVLEQQADSADERFAAIHGYKHLHNNYLDFLVRFGLVGFVLMSWIVLLAISMVVIKYRTHLLSSRYVFLLASVFLLIAAAAMTNVYFFTWDSRVLGVILAAIAVTRTEPAER